MSKLRKMISLRFNYIISEIIIINYILNNNNNN